MAKTVIIRTGDFEANRLTQVTLTEQVPCASLTLDKSEINATSLDPQTITATVLPADCSDVLTWESSDETVATVNDGVVTIVGLGETTITATCGRKTASCAVTVGTIEISSGFGWGTVYVYGDNNYARANVPSEYKTQYYADKIPLDSTRLRLSRVSAFVGDFNLAPVVLPLNVGKIRITASNASEYNILTYQSNQVSSSTGVALLIDKNAETAPSGGVVDATFDISECDAFTAYVKYKNAYSVYADEPDTIATQNGFKVYLMQAEGN